MRRLVFSIAFRLAVPALLGLVAAGSSSWAQTAPKLILDPGGHMSSIRNIIFTPDGKSIVSAADDKVIRVWDIKRGVSVRTLRGQIGSGNRGKIYALALNPSGRMLAAAGRMREVGEGSHPIRLYDFRSGEIVGLLDGHQGAVLSLDFSPDGQFLVSGSTDDTAIIWHVADRQIIAHLRGHAADINRAKFTRDGERVATASDDRTVGLWNARTGAPLAQSSAHVGNVFGLDISPTTGEIATSSQSGELRISNPKTLRIVRRFKQPNMDLLGLSYSADGKRLITGAGTAPYMCLVWNARTGKVMQRYRSHDHLVLTTATHPTRDLIASAGGSNHEIHLWRVGRSRPIKRLQGRGQGVWSVGITRDGHHLAWGHSLRTKSLNNQGPLQRTLRLPHANRTMGEPKPLLGDTARFVRAAVRRKGLKLSHHAGGEYGYFADLRISKQRRVKATVRRNEKSGFAHNAYSFLGNRDAVVSGSGNGWLSAFDLAGRKLGDFIGHTSDIWAVTSSADGDLLVSGSDDQTIRLWNASTFENIVSIFQGSKGRWIIWTPQGYYAASPGGDKFVGWHINRGPGAAALFVTAAQLKQHFYRPDIVRRAIELASARKAIGEANVTDFKLSELFARQPPDVAISSPRDGAKIGSSPLDLTLRIQPNRDAVDGFDVTVNGRRIASRRDGSPAGTTNKDHEVQFRIPLSKGANTIELVAHNKIGKLTKSLRVVHTGQPDLDKRGKLIIVAVGVNKYINYEDQDLNFAEIDATSLRNSLIKYAGPLHISVESHLLTTSGKEKSPTAAQIKKTLQAFRSAGPRDTVVLFMAGHGINQGSDYLFLPTDAAQQPDGDFDSSTVVSWRALHQAIESARGQRIIFMDTCFSGNAYNPRLIKDAADDKIAVLAATDAETLAAETNRLGHGVFTHSVLEGLRGSADLKKDGRIVVGELSEFVTRKVVKLTRGEQTPTSHISSGRYFVLARHR
ncbi:MAG: caspase family protein [Hyphomicrobiaceae bacterium]